MPIPISDLQKQIKTPNVTEGKAVNFADQAAAHLQAMNDDIVRSGNLLATGIQMATAQYVNAKRQASDDAAKQAFNDYEVAKDDLNTQLQSLEGQDAVNFYYGDYTKKINEAHKKLTATLDSLPDKDIAQNYRDKVNQINMQNRGFSFLAAKKQENVVRDADHKAFIQNISLEHVNDMVTAPEGVNRYSYAANNAYRDINRANTEYLASKGLATPDMVKAVNQEAMTKFAGEMLRNVANAADWDGSKTGAVYQNEILPAVKSLEKYIDQGTYQELLQYYAHEAINTDAALRPKDFINPKTGEIDKDFVNNNYEGLTPWQKTKAISAVQEALSKGGNSNLSDDDKHWLQQYQNQKLANFKAILSDIGLSTTDDYKIMQLQQGLTKEEMAEVRKNAIKNFKLDKAMDAWVEMQEMLDKRVTLPSGKVGFWDDSRLNDMRNDLQQYVELYVQGYNDQLKKREGFGRVLDYIMGENTTVKQAAMHDLIKSQQERKGYEQTRRESLGITSALYSMAKQMSLDPSVNWDAEADSREGFRNPAVLDKIKKMSTMSLGEPGGGIDVFGKTSLQNLESLNSPTAQPMNAYQQAYNQFRSRIESGAPTSARTQYAVGQVNYDRGIDWLNKLSEAKAAKQSLSPVEQYKLDQMIRQSTDIFFNSIVNNKIKKEEEQQKEIDAFNGGFAK